ncbi:MAG: hypothetical protein IKK33_06280, partial [Lachnospiraceae bacterium]|nr:hypothetical protein [Lachnospiraceae bacterium]
MIPQAFLKLDCNIDYLSILDISVKNKVGNHGEMKVKLLVEYEKSEDMPKRIRGTEVNLNDDTNSRIFSGICVEAEVFEAPEYRELDIEVMTHSVLADMEKEYNTYQSMSKTLGELFEETYDEYSATLIIDKDVEIPFTLSQEHETDWKFLKRIAAQYGKEVFVNPRVARMYVFVGEPDVTQRNIPYRTYGTHVDVNAMRTDMLSLGITVSSAEYQVLDVETEVLNICPGDLINGYRVVENEIFSDGGLMVNRLGLQRKGTVHANALESHNAELESQILTGIVEQVEGNFIQVSYPTDKGETGDKPWIPYESAISNSFYCMPDVGNEVYIYYDNTGQTVCLGSKRTDISSPDFDIPEDNSMSFMGNVIRLATDRIELENTSGEGEGQVARITMSQQALEIYSDTGININAKEAIGILADVNGEFTPMQNAIQDCNELHKAGSQIHKEHGGRGYWEQVGLNFASGWDKYWETAGKNFLGSLHLDVLGKAAKGYEALADYILPGGTVLVGNSPNHTNIEINALNELVLQVTQDNQILLNKNINISTKHFEWVGTSKHEYQEKSVSDANWLDTVLDGLQLVLDFAGLIPVWGFIPDLINAAISLVRGDLVGFGLNLLSAIPGLGDACQVAKLTGKGAKAIIKAGKAIDTFKNLKWVKKISKIADNVDMFFLVPETVSSLVDIWTREGTSNGQDWADTSIVIGNFIFEIVDQSIDKKKEKDSDSENIPEGSENRNNNGNSGSNGEGNTGTRLGSSGEGSSNTNKTNSDKERTTDSAGDPVNMVTGSFKIAHRDMSYKDILGVFPLVRTYESVYTNEGHMLGNRWIYNLESRMYINGDEITVRMPDNHLEHFVPDGIQWCNKREGDTLYTLSEEKNGYTLYNKQERKTYFYNTEGLLETISDKNNNYTHFSYEGKQLSKVVLSSGVYLSFAYEGKKLRSITDNINREISYEYEGEYLTKVYYPNGAIVKYEYDGSGNIIGVWDENGQKFITSKYDRKGRVLHQLMADGEEYIYLYDDANKVNTFLTVSTGSSVKYEYNRNNLVTAIIYPDQTREEKEYDGGDNLIRYKDRMGNVTTYTYDSSGNLLQRELPNGLTLTCIYDENNYLVKSFDNIGRESRFSYDANYNLISNKVKIEEGVFIEKCFEYDDVGRIVAYIDENGNRTEYYYDCDFENPTCVVMADGTQKNYTYDAAGRMMSQDNGKTILKYAYNPFDCMTSIIDEEGNTTKFVYDLACKLTKIIRPKEYRENALQGAGIEYTYDALQRLVRTMNPCGDISAVQVNCAGATTKEIHPNSYALQGEQGSGIEKIYDMFGNMTHVKYPEGGTRRRIYNALGQCIKDIGPAEYKEADDEGAGYEYEYDAVGRMTQITDPYGTVIKKYIYNLMGSIEKEIDAKGMDTGTTDAERIGTVYEYNLCGWLTQIRQPVSYEDGKAGYRLTTYEYDKTGNIITEKRYLDEQTLNSQSGRVNIVHRKYDVCGRLVCVSDNLGAEIIYKYDGNGNLTYESRKINDEHKQIRSWSYNKRGKVEQYLQTADFKSTKQKAAKITFAYDENANLVKRILPDGSEIYYSYDAAGRVVSETHKEKKGGIRNTTYYEYDHAGNLTAVRDNKGITIRYEYDLLNRRVKEIGATGATTKYCYSVNGKLDKMIPPVDYAAGSTTGIRYTYDSCGRLTELVGRDNEVLFSQEFNAYGEVIRQQHAGLKPISYQYDFAGRRTGSISGEQRSEQITYDALGNVKAVTDGNANTTTYEYDTWGRITGIKHADGSGENYAYDYAGNIVESVDGNGNHVQYSFNEINKLSQITWQDETTEQFGYDISGNLSKQILRDGRSIHYTYNMYQNLTSRRNGGGTVEESYVYDEDGRLRSAIAGGMRYEYVYNPDGSLREKCASGKTLIAYEYDLNGNIIKQKDISGKTVNYTYDGYNRLNSVYDNERLLAEYEYTAFGRKKSVRIPGITETGYEYDGDANLTLHSVKTTEGILAENRYAYDGNGNITTKSGLYGEYQYSYDEL